MNIIEQLETEMSQNERNWLDSADYKLAASQLLQGHYYATVVRRLHNWAQDYETEAYCEGIDAIRFDADH